MRVLIVAPHLGTFIRDQVLALRTRVEEIAALVLRPFPRFLDPLERGRIEVAAPAGLRTQQYRSVWLSSRYRTPRASWSRAASVLSKIARERSYDIVHGHFLYPAGRVAIDAAVPPPVVMTGHGYDVYSLPRRSEAWRQASMGAALRAKRVIAVSKRNAEIVSNAGVPKERIRVIPNGYDPDLFPPLSRANARRSLNLPEGRYVAAIGDLVPIKRYDLLIRALSGLPSDVRLVILGRGRERGRLEYLARPFAGRVLLAGQRPHAEVHRWIAAADVVALSSDDEGSPTVIPEAFAMGRPVVATRVGGVPELVGEGVGLLASPGDPEGISSALATALAEPWDERRIRRHGEAFSWPRLAREILATYEEAQAR